MARLLTKPAIVSVQTWIKISAVFTNNKVRAWSSVAYLFPGLHPDGFEDADSGWPRGWQRIAAEAWRRVEAGAITEAELYPSDAQWCGLYDRMFPHTVEEIKRRLALAADYGEAL
jgi:hypothetical protein